MAWFSSAIPYATNWKLEGPNKKKENKKKQKNATQKVASGGGGGGKKKEETGTQLKKKMFLHFWGFLFYPSFYLFIFFYLRISLDG